MPRIAFGVFFPVPIVALIAAPLSQAQISRLESEVLKIKDCMQLSLPGHYPDYEPLPKYKIEREANSPDTLSLMISVSPAEALSGTAMVRLGCKLAGAFPNAGKIRAFIFDDKTAAMNVALRLTDQFRYGEYLWHLRGRYDLDRKTGQASIEILFPTFEEDMLRLMHFRYELKNAF